MGMGAGADPMAAMTGADPNKALEAERAALEMVGSCLMLALSHETLCNPDAKAETVYAGRTLNAVYIDNKSASFGVVHTSALPPAAEHKCIGCSGGPQVEVGGSGGAGSACSQSSAKRRAPAEEADKSSSVAAGSIVAMLDDV